MRAKLIVLYLLTLMGVLSVLYWKLDSHAYQEKLKWNEAQSRMQLSALQQSLQSELQGWGEVLELSFPQVAAVGRDYGMGQVFSRFLMMAKLSKQPEGEWSLEQKFFQEGAPVKNWAPSYVTLALKNFKTDWMAPGSVAFLALWDPQRKPYFFVLTKSRASNDWYGTLLEAHFFQSIMDGQKGQLSTLAIVNSLGQSLGHTTPEYVGRDLRQNAMVAELMDAGSAAGSGFFTGGSGEKVQGFYEQVAESNIYVMTSTPIAALQNAGEKLRFQVVLLGLGLALLGVAALLWLYNPEPVAVEQHREEASSSVVPRPPREVSLPVSTLKAPVPLEREVVKLTTSLPLMIENAEVEETLNMIDEIDRPPAVVPEAPKVPSEKSRKAVVATAVPLVGLGSGASMEVAVPSIKIEKRTSKLDSFPVHIRRPGERL